MTDAANTRSRWAFTQALSGIKLSDDEERAHAWAWLVALLSLICTFWLLNAMGSIL